MTGFLILLGVSLAGALVGWLARSRRAHVLARRRKLAADLRRDRPQPTAHDRARADLRALIARIDCGMWDTAVETSLPPELKRRSTA